MALFLGLAEEELQVFSDEMAEHVDTLEAELLAMEKGGPDGEGVARAFRAIHTIKGAAAAVGLEQMADLTHAMEEILDHVRSEVLIPTSAEVTVLLRGVDYLRRALEAIEEHTMPEDVAPALIEALGRIGMPGEEDALVQVRVRILPQSAMPAVRALQVLLGLKELGEVISSEPSEAQVRASEVGEFLEISMGPTTDPEAVRAALARISEIELVSLSGQRMEPELGLQATSEPVADSQGEGDGGGEATSVVPNSQSRPNADRTIRVDVGILDNLMNLVGELVIDRGRLGGIGQVLAEQPQVQELSDDLGQVTAHLARVTNALHEQVLKARMLPVHHVFRKYPRMVRDLARQMDKQVDFRVAGEDTELDRSLLEVLGDSLMHLLRNSLDHGLESPAERRAVGKPEKGILQLTAGYEESQVMILVQDDGRGIDPERIRATALRKGIITEERALELDQEEAIQLLFAPGFSTSEHVTDVSGRGVGLDVVRRHIERVGGRIEVESQVGLGTTFRMLLPLTLATIQALLVQVDDDSLAIPLSAISEVLQVPESEINQVGGRQMIRVRGDVVPLMWLRRFTDPGFEPVPTGGGVIAVLVNHKGEQVGLVVDRLVGEQEVVVKGLGDYLGQIKGISGVTILGDGSLALIVDMGGLVSLLVSESTFRGAAAAGGYSR